MYPPGLRNRNAGSSSGRGEQTSMCCAQATSISPWVVTFEALEPFRCAWVSPLCCLCLPETLAVRLHVSTRQLA